MLKIGGDGSVDPGEDGAIHLHPRRAIGMGHVGEHVIRERVLAEDDEQEVAPAIVVVGGAIQCDGDEHLDVDDGKGLGVDSSVFHLIGIEGSDTLGFSLGGGLALEALLLDSSGDGGSGGI